MRTHRLWMKSHRKLSRGEWYSSSERIKAKRHAIQKRQARLQKTFKVGGKYV